MLVKVGGVYISYTFALRPWCNYGAVRDPRRLICGTM
jgi:hypothetical protein